MPWASYAAVADPVGIAFYHELLESIWTGARQGPALSPAGCRVLLDLLDDVPAATQAMVGTWIIGKRRELEQQKRRTGGCVAIGSRLLAYVCDSGANAPQLREWQAELAALTAVARAAWP